MRQQTVFSKAIIKSNPSNIGYQATRPGLNDNRLFNFQPNQKRLGDKCWTQFLSIYYWSAIKGMSLEKPKPTTRIRARRRSVEIAEIVHQETKILGPLQTSRGRLTYYKGGRRNTEGDTLKTLERATHIHRPCFLLFLDLFLYRSHLCNSIKFNLLYSILLINKVHFYLLETVYIVVF